VFTGIIRGVGTIAARSAVGGDERLTVDIGTVDMPAIEVGDSIAVNGVCLTVTDAAAARFSADVSRATLAVTTLGTLGVGAAVNVEPALRVGDALSGHFVTGHVDGVGQVRALGTTGRSQRLEMALDTSLARYVARKGSIAVDGVSLTVNEVTATGFAVNIVPHTRKVTIISGYRVGTAVNIEVDVIARYLERLAVGSEGVDLEFLREHGYTVTGQ
jgi:riboflavin synthase